MLRAEDVATTLNPASFRSWMAQVPVELEPPLTKTYCGMLVLGETRSEEQAGYGGLEHSWESMPWTKAVTDSLFVRAKAGPYVMQVMWLVGRPENNYKASTSSSLYCDGKLGCRPQRVVEKADECTFGDFQASHALIVDKLLDGDGIPATFRHKNVGYRIQFLSQTKWSFELRHGREWWKMPTSKPGPGATGSSAFVVSVKAGLVGSGDIFQRFGMAGQVEMPE